MLQPVSNEELEHKVKSVIPLEDYKIQLDFDDGQRRLYDIKQLLEYDPFSKLTDEVFFRQIHILPDGTVGWDNSLGICSDCIYDHGIWMEP